VRDAARVARSGAALFVFTFSRNTFPADTTPVPGEPFVFTQFSGQPQCFLTESQLIEELLAMKWWDWPMEKINRNKPLFTKNLMTRPSLTGLPIA